MKTLRIANAQGFWGDQSDAAKTLLTQDPTIDFITLDYLAELSLSIMALQKKEGKGEGFAKDFIEVIQSLIPFWNEGLNFKVIANAGGLNPKGCLEACLSALKGKLKKPLKVACITGDDVFEILKKANSNEYKNLDTDEPIGQVQGKLLFGNAYTGAFEIAKALKQGADIVITGRASDPSLTLGPCIAQFNWEKQNYDKLAQGTVAGHLIECGTQATGGFSTDWLNINEPETMGFPIAEVNESGDFVITKPKNSGGAVTEDIIKEQLLYEISDPKAYLSADVNVSFLNVQLKKIAPDIIQVTGCKGSPPSQSYKVNAAYLDGYRIESMLTVCGDKAYEKAKKTSEIILKRLEKKGVQPLDLAVEFIGANPLFCKNPELVQEITLRIALKVADMKAAELFSKEIAPMITSGPQGIIGYATSRPHPRPVFAFWPTLISKDKVHLEITLKEVQ